MHDHLHSIIENVPVDYYQNGTKNNFLQRYWHFNKLKKVISFIDFNPKRILDVGCASGWFLSEVLKIHKDAKAYGIDVYEEAIDYGSKLYPKINFSVSDAHKTKFPDKYFDLVICTEVIEHLEDPKKAIIEMKRILSKDGRIILEVDSGSILFSIVWFLWRKINGKVWNDSHLHSFNIEKLENTVNEIGLRVVKKEKFNFGMAMIFLLENE